MVILEGESAEEFNRKADENLKKKGIINWKDKCDYCKNIIMKSRSRSIGFLSLYGFNKDNCKCNKEDE